LGKISLTATTTSNLAEVAMVISSRTPEGSPNLCPVCGSRIKVEPSDPAADAPCPTCGHRLWFAWDDLGETQVLRPIRGILRSEDLDRLFDRVAETPKLTLVIDLGGVQFVSSTVLGRLIDLKKKVAGTGGTLKIENLHPDLLEVFRITRLDKLFDVGE
jgi:anti-anti-sigma factor